jgi:hypothetical protein
MLMTVWRIKLNSQRSEEDGGSPDWDEAKEYCRKAGLVGVGWGLSNRDRVGGLGESTSIADR